MNYQLVANRIKNVLEELFITVSEDNYELLRGIVENYLVNGYDIYNDDDIDEVMSKLFEGE